MSRSVGLGRGREEEVGVKTLFGKFVPFFKIFEKKIEHPSKIFPLHTKKLYSSPSKNS